MSQECTDGNNRPNRLILVFPNADARSVNSRKAEIIEGVDGALMEGVLFNSPERVQAALNQGANPMVMKAWPLQTATEAGNMELLCLLLPLTDVAATGHRALFYAAEFARYPEVISLLAARADQGTLDLALCLTAASASALPCAAALVDAGADPKAYASRALANALVHGRSSVAAMLFPMSDPRSWGEGDMTIDYGHPWGALRLVATQGSVEGLARVLRMASPPMEVLRGILSASDSDGASEEARHAIMEHISAREAELLLDSLAGPRVDRPPARRV